MPETIEMTLRGVLLAGKWRDEAAVKAMSDEDCRKTAITILDSLTDQHSYSKFDTDALIGRAAVAVFLRDAVFLDEAPLKTMSDDDLHKTAVFAIHERTSIPVLELWGLPDQILIMRGLEHIAPGRIEMTLTLRGVLLAGKWRDEAAVKAMPDEDCRNTVITILKGLTDQHYYPKFDNDALIGKAAVLIFLRDAGIRSEEALKAMSDADQRNTLIVENHNHTGIPVVELQAMTGQKLVELGLQWSAMTNSTTYSGDGTFEKPLLFDTRRTILEPEDGYYVHTSVHLNATRESRFNTLEKRRTKNVKISGVKVIFDRGNAYKKQMAFQGDDVLDLKALEIYADQVIIRLPLRFPRTNVTIHARELIFEGNGHIDTSPTAFKAPAVSPFRGEYGPLDKAGGEPTYRAADGANGENAGDIKLYVRRILEKGPGKIRFISKGSKGQNAEEGGLRKYKPREGVNQPAADKGNTLLPVSCSDIRSYVEEVTVNKNVDTWRWPGEVSSPEKVSMTPNDALKNNKVTHCRLILFDDNVISSNVRRTFFPGKDSRTNHAWVHLVPPGSKVMRNRTDMWSFEGDADGGRLRPGDGQDAYASGKPGDGGAGGRIVASLPSSVAFEHLCVVDGGDPADRSKDIAGGEPGGPFPAYELHMRLVRKESYSWLDSSIPPTYSLTEVSAKPGQAAAGKTGNPGANGATERAAGKLTAWASPEALGAVVCYARDAYRNGHRERALELLDPYYYVLFCEKNELPTALLGYFIEMSSIRANVINNLDFYGNPPGWLPRLDVESNYQIWNLFSKRSSAALYFAQKLENDWDKVADEQAALDEVSTALTTEWDATAGELQKAYQELKKAKDKLDKIRELFEAKQTEVDRLRLEAATDAKTKLFEQQVFSGVMNLVGGLAQCIPVGQPYLGLAGKTMSLAGDIDWNNPDSSKQIGSFFTGLSKETGAFLEDNEDLFVERSRGNVPKPPGKKEDRLKLKDQLKAATGAVEAVDSKVKSGREEMDNAIKTEWAATLQSTSTRVRDEIHDLNERANALTGAAKTAAQDEMKVLEDFQKELEDTAKLKFVGAKSKFYEELSYLEKGVKAKASETVSRKAALLEKAEEIEKKQSDLKRLDEIYAADKEVAEEKTKDLLKNLSGLSDGISKIGRGIATLTRPYNEKELDRLTEQILQGSKYADAYRKLLSEAKAINTQKAQAATLFCYQQQLVSTYTERITSAAIELNALSNQRQVADGVLDPGVKEYLQGMASRAKENLLWSQYHFVKAWQYEDLVDVPDDFYNVEQWVQRFREFERQKAGLGAKELSSLTYDDQKKMANTFLKESDFTEIGAKVREACVTNLIKPILEERQHHPLKKTNVKKCLLKEEQRTQLREQGRVAFNLVDDFGISSLLDVKEKIVGIDLEVFQVDSDSARFAPYVEFVHSGVSVLYGTNKKYYKFQKGQDDSPISWGFNYNHSDYLRLKAQADGDDDSGDDIWNFKEGGPITKDKKDDVENPVIAKELGQKLKYSEYRPSFFSDITLWLNRGQHHNEAAYKAYLAQVKSIEKVQFAVTYVWEGTM